MAPLASRRNSTCNSTRRLHQWRADFGSELAWSRVLGQACWRKASALDFMRQSLLPLDLDP
jgi:hypothetical protein